MNKKKVVKKSKSPKVQKLKVQKNLVTKVVKRSGKVVSFDPKKITLAVAKAFAATGEGNFQDAQKVSEKLVQLLNKNYKKGYIPEIEEIQDLVERVLMILDFDETAKAYILYRSQHEKIRETEKTLDEAVNLVDSYIQEMDWKVKENANMSYSLQGLNNYVASIVSSKYWMSRVYSVEIKNAHKEGDMHIHDLQLIAAYCCGWDLQDLLRRGFTGVSGKVSCKPAKHFGAALGQMVNFIYTLQGEVAGAQAFSNFDTLLAPFVRYDKLNYEQVKQNIQSFVFNMNVATRVGFQTPFSNITLDIKAPKTLAQEAVVIGGAPQKETYGDFQEEMNMINKAFAEVMIEGDSSGRIFTFPIPTYNIGKNFDWNDDNFNPIWEMTAKYGIPYFANFINSDMDPEDARSMCPLAGEEKVLIRSSRGRILEFSEIRNIYEGNSHQEEHEVYSDGKFVKATLNKFNNQKMIKVILENGHEIKMSIEHLNYVAEKMNGQEKTLKGENLKTGMYLPYSLNSYKGKGGNPDLGYFVGAYAGDGSLDGEGTVVFSLENHFKKEVIEKIAKIAAKYFGAHSVVKEYQKSKLVSLKIHSRAAVGLCLDFVESKKREKCYRSRLFSAGIDFRKQVLAGHYATDGGNRNRIYTSSPKMVETLNMLAATLGTATSIYKDQREGRLGKEPNYAVLFYQLNRNNYGNVWFKKNKKLWIKIKKIEQISNSAAYCFQIKTGKSIFTVGSTGILTHNCRLRLDNRELYKRGGGLFGANPQTGSVGVVTINLPRLGYISKNKKEFYQNLNHLMDLAKESLEIKRKMIENLTDKGLYPYTKVYLESIKMRRGKYWSNHFSTIGLVGMNEAILNLIGKNIATKEGQKLAEEMLVHMRDRIIGYQKETGNLFNLEATPAEGTTYRLARIDREKYPEMIFANNEAVKNKTAEPYYTNSSQLPVGFTDDLFEALDLQDKLQTKYTGGTVLHGFLGERIYDIETTKKLVRKIAENYSLPYFTLTPTFSVCPVHGYLSGEHYTCPKCVVEQKTEVYSRVVGYIRPVQQWHEGKQAEFEDRKEFVIKK